MYHDVLQKFQGQFSWVALTKLRLRSLISRSPSASRDAINGANAPLNALPSLVTSRGSPKQLGPQSRALQPCLSAFFSFAGLCSSLNRAARVDSGQGCRVNLRFFTGVPADAKLHNCILVVVITGCCAWTVYHGLQGARRSCHSRTFFDKLGLRIFEKAYDRNNKSMDEASL